MPISANSIIHYTNTFEKIKSIINDGFRIKYCAEKFKVEGTKGSSAAHPMICFCDIPLSQSYKHFSAYGKYGIGLSKEWANRKGINPVLYLENNSSITNTLAELLKDRRQKNNNLNESQKANILRIKCFTKNYSGNLKRNGKKIMNYRFYDEREWRLVPNNQQLNGAPFSVNYTKYIKNKEKYNNRISNLRVTFEPDDISYIIVKNTLQIPKMIKVLRKKWASQILSDQLDLFISKICSSEQILNDY